jgi:translation initiation factor 2 beta subunit (eIF-2beta)/eIF-5
MSKRGRPKKTDIENQENIKDDRTLNLFDNTDKLFEFIKIKVANNNQEYTEDKIIFSIPDIVNNQDISQDISQNISKNISSIVDNTKFFFDIVNLFLSKYNIEIVNDDEREQLLISLMQFDFFRNILLRYMKYFVIVKVIGLRILKIFLSRKETNNDS